MMGECTLCSLIQLIFGGITNILLCALDYPIIIFFLSLFFVIIFFSNMNYDKFFCDFVYCVRNLNATAINCNSPAACTLADGSGDAVVTNSIIFDYGMERGAHTWSHSGINQSPINIIDENVQRLPIRELLTWNHYDDLPFRVQLENTGHTVIMRAFYSGNVPTICGADLLASYTFVQICFRWSSGNNGSEHMLNYRKYPLEIQAMHRTGPQTTDCTSSYDLLMIAYFYELSSNNPYLDPIIQNLYRIQLPNTKADIPPFPLSYLCQQFRTGFYSYGGSLTEPPCYQGAEWFIDPEPLAISERQLNEFRQLLSSNGKTRIMRNSRPVQNIDCQRTVNLNFYNPVETAPHLPPTDCAVQCDFPEPIVT